MTAEDYCTVTDVRNYLGLTSADNMGPSDSIITGFISNASRTVDAYALRQFSGTESKVEWFDTTWGLGHLTLSALSILSLLLNLPIPSELSPLSPLAVTVQPIDAFSPTKRLESSRSSTRLKKPLGNESK